jgi:hypothetical protein
MFLFGKVTPAAVVKSCVVVMVELVVVDMPCATLALAEYLLMRLGITMADKAKAVNVNVASDFFIVDILY